MTFLIPVAHHEDRYLISKEGYVQSKWNNNILKPQQNPNGYLKVTLDGKQLSLHRLVAKHFIPNPYDYDQVNHIDGDKTNNHVSNLEWCSAAQNIQHALKTGLRKGFIPYDLKVTLMNRAIAGELIADLVTELQGTQPNTLSRMLRITAKKEGKETEWKKAMKVRRRNVAISNLQTNNTVGH